MDADEALTAVNVCRAVGLFHVHGPEDGRSATSGWVGWGFKSSKNWDETRKTMVFFDGSFMMVIPCYTISGMHIPRKIDEKHVNFMNRNGGFGGGSKSCPTNMGVQATNMGCVINKNGDAINETCWYHGQWCQFW